MEIKKIKRVHLIGIGGIGVSAVAKLFLARKKEVTGSDAIPSLITKELEQKGIKVFYGHDGKNLDPKTDLVIFSPAVPSTNPERVKAKELDIDELSYPEFLGKLSSDYKTIAIAGTNGKSTTTAMAGKIFELAGLDPTVIVGTQVPGFDGNLRIGHSKLLIVEACEWRAHMLNLHPETIVLTNLEPDHLDFYKNLDEIKHYFQLFVNRLTLGKGLLCYNADDPAIASLAKTKGFKTKSWSLNNPADYTAAEISVSSGEQHFKIKKQEFVLRIPGLFNIDNALAAITLAKSFHIKDEIIAQALAEFSNSWRRFELLGNLKGKKGTLVITDYAHHPTAIKGTLKAAKEFYPDLRLVAVFQPHHFDRTAKLLEEFGQSFAYADLVIVNEIYDVPGRENDGERKITGADLTALIARNNPDKKVIFSANLEQTKEMVSLHAQDNDLILFMGAGDIDNLAREIVK